MIGLIALFGAWIPFVSLFFAVPLGLLGICFAIAGYAQISNKVASNTTMTTFGLLTSLAGIVASIAVTVMVGSPLDSPS